MTTDVDELLNRDATMRDYSKTYELPLRLNNGVLESDLPDEPIAEENLERLNITPDQEAPETPQEELSFFDYLKDVAVNVGDAPNMVARGGLSALGEMAYSANLIDKEQANSFRELLKASGEIAEGEGVNPIVRGLGEGLSQFGAGMFGPFKIMRAAGVARPIAALIAEGISGAFAFNPDDPNLGQFINSFEGRPEWLGAMADFIETDPNDTEAENRFKNMLQDVVPSAMIEGMIKIVSKARSMDADTLVQAGEEAEQRLASQMQGTTLSANPVGSIGDMAVSAVGKLARKNTPKEQARMVSARYPTAVKKDEDPIATQLNIGYEALAADQKVLQRNTDVLRIYPGLRPKPSANPEEFAGQFIDDVKQNLIYLHNKVPEQTRQRSKLWYDGANKIAKEFSAKYKVPDTSVAGVMAALSPQKDWFMNVSLAERTLDVLSNQKTFGFSKDMALRMNEIFPGPKYVALRKMMLGKTLNDLSDPVEKAFFVRIYDETYADRSHRIITPEGDFGDAVLTDKGKPSGTGWGSLVEISKAVRAYESGGDRSLMTEIMGSKHKVRSFYNNIIEPNSANGDVTIDTHAVAAALLRPVSGQSREVHHNFGSTPMKVKQPKGWQGAANSSKTGVQGTYGLYAEAYRQAAAELGILPRQLQSITWEAVRGLFTDRFKTGKNNVSDINKIWTKYSSGKLSIDETRNAVEERSGGINAPSWE